MTDHAVYLYEKPPVSSSFSPWPANFGPPSKLPQTTTCFQGSSSQLASYMVKYPLTGSKQKEVDVDTIPDSTEEGVKFAFALLSQNNSSFIATGNDPLTIFQS